MKQATSTVERREYQAAEAKLQELSRRDPSHNTQASVKADELRLEIKTSKLDDAMRNAGEQRFGGR